MRPIRLVLEGLRSYRSRQELRFDDAALFAITGPTGAGKSSILDAIFYALYGACMWDQRNVTALISDGLDTVSVSLEFEVGGRRWEVVRSASRGRPGVHSLRALDGPERADNAREVDRRIAQLLGLDADDFLKTVILPQGRFQALLHSTPAERAPILKGLLGLDELEQLAGLAAGRRDRLKSLVDRASEQRRGLPDDPAAEVARHTQALEDGARERERLQALLAGFRVAQAELEEGRRELARREQARERLAGLEPVSVEPLRPLEREFEEAGSAREAALAQVAARLVELEGVLTSRPPSADLRRLEGEVRWLQEQEPRLEADRVRLAEGTEELERERQALRDMEQERSGLVSTGGDLHVQAAQAQAHRQKEVLETAREALRKARQAQALWSGLAEQREGRRRDLAQAESRLPVLAEARAEAEAALQAAAGELEAARLRHRAADVARHVHAGEPCPVCDRPLPEGFAPPAAPDLEEAKRGHEAADEMADAARLACQQATAEIDAARRVLKELDERLAEAAESVIELCGHAGRIVEDLAQPDAQLLRTIAEACEQAEATAREVATQAKVTEAKRNALDQQVKDVSRRVATREGAMAKDERLLREQAAESARRREELLRALGAPDVAAAAARLGEDLRVVGKAEEERALLWHRQGELHEQRHALSERRRRELEQPLEEALRRLQRWSDLLEADALPGPGAPLEEIEASAARLVAARESALKEAEARRSELAARLAAREAELQARLAAEGLASMPDLEARATAAAVAEETARRALEAAQEAAARAAGLDEALLPARRMLRSLDFLAQRLTHRPGSFPMWLLEVRQRELLEIASRRLGEMTGNQYGFSPSFMMVDRVTMSERAPRTLSGGETFLASLSLALALSEIVGRKGGRLEAFFLDEGFGNLSPESLERALDALEALSGTGRLIGVISHVPAVAERIEQVWRVTRTAEGSRVERLGAVPAEVPVPG